MSRSIIQTLNVLKLTSARSASKQPTRRPDGFHGDLRIGRDIRSRITGDLLLHNLHFPTLGGAKLTTACEGSRTMPPSPMAETDPVTVVVTRIIKPGCEDAFRASVDDVRVIVAKYPGYKGLTLHAPRAGEDRWVLVYAFDTGAHLDAWLNSDQRTRWVAQADLLAEGGYTHTTFSGMEPFFALPDSVARPSPPPKWKMAVTTAAAVWPLSQVLGYTVQHPPRRGRVRPAHARGGAAEEVTSQSRSARRSCRAASSRSASPISRTTPSTSAVRNSRS